MADYTLFPAKVVTPEGVAFEGQVQELEVTSVAGGLGILARRSPIVADLKRGHVRARLEDGSWKTWASAEGFAQASDSTATVVVEDAVALEDISDEQAEQIVATGRERLAAAEGSEDHDSAVAAAEKAIAWGEHLREIKARY
jgi:F-type H+-transporting ATPase subunit epsilon